MTARWRMKGDSRESVSSEHQPSETKVAITEEPASPQGPAPDKLPSDAGAGEARAPAAPAASDAVPAAADAARRIALFKLPIEEVPGRVPSKPASVRPRSATLFKLAIEEIARGPRPPVSNEAAQAPGAPHSSALVNLPVGDIARAPAMAPTLDARAQSALLREAFSPDPKPAPQTAPAPGTTPPPPEPEPEPKPVSKAPPSRPKSPWPRRLLKTAIGLAVAVVVGWTPVLRMLELTSTEAVVNARLVTLRSPLEGEITAFAISPEIGAQTKEGGLVLRVVNPRADRARLDDLRRMIAEVGSQRPAFVTQIASLRRERERVSEQASAFQRGRIRELEARVEEATSALAAATATRTEADTAAHRAATLAQSGYGTKAGSEKAQRDLTVAIETENSLRHRLAGIAIELEATRHGSYIGDSYNDRPSSMQRIDELAVRITDLEAELQSRNERIKLLDVQLKKEESRYAELTEAEVVSPVTGTVWEMLVSPGEEVRRGQDLMRLLDCSGVVVTASVTETVYNRLRLGDSARFRLIGETTDHWGTIIRLSGLAAPPDNLAILPSSLVNAAYRVHVVIPEFVGSSCAVGRTGKFVFQSARPPDSGAARAGSADTPKAP